MPVPTRSLKSPVIRLFLLSTLIALPMGTMYALTWFGAPSAPVAPEQEEPTVARKLLPRHSIDTGAFTVIAPTLPFWGANATLPQVRDALHHVGFRTIVRLDREIEGMPELNREAILNRLLTAACYMFEGRPDETCRVLEKVRAKVEQNPEAAREWLADLMFFQAIAAFRQGENENCIMCRGESSCIVPISPAAIHKNPDGSRLAIKHLSDFLAAFPDDIEARWLLTLAHMTLGEFPEGVDPRYRLDLDHFLHSAADIGRFRDIGHLVGVNRFNQAGGVVMDDIDNDGKFDLVVSCFDMAQVVGLYRNSGDGHFEELAEKAGLGEQVGGLICVQTDYNNDGLLDIYIVRGAWMPHPVRPSLLRNDGNWQFTDVTEEAGLLDPVNSNSAQWADYDNDGWVDLFVCCERQSHRLYRNLGNGTFEDVAHKAGLTADRQLLGKGSAWIDYDNDNYPDLFINYLGGSAQLYHNNRDGTFTNVTDEMGIRGPERGFACWAWDYDNDGWTDIFATSYDRTTADVVNGMMRHPHSCQSNRLYRNLNGKGFLDVTAEAGLDLVFATMGSNYGDFDNDGYLDMYLGTGEPNLATLIPNRMFKCRDGQKFVEITASAGVGHLQKGHAIACGDWDRDGNVDIFAQLGGAIPGDQFHNVLFQNPGHDNRWLSVKLAGRQTNRAALGARIKIVTAGDEPQTICRTVSPGGSFGSSPLEQTIGIGNADRIALLEIRWPTSDTTQIFRDVAVNKFLDINEFETEFRKPEITPIPLPGT